MWERTIWRLASWCQNCYVASMFTKHTYIFFAGCGGMQISCVNWSRCNIHKCCLKLCFPVCTQILQTLGSVIFHSRSTFIGKNVQSPSITAPDSYYVVVVLDKNDEDIRRFAGRYICINVLDCSMTAIHHSYSSETNFSIMVNLELAKYNLYKLLLFEGILKALL